ncbi:MAG: TolC family protein [Bacteroidetes bacterium]|nr:TolC family protein [Bacteroidota bacterium]
MVTFWHRKSLWVFGLLVFQLSVLSSFAQEKKYSLSELTDSALRHLPALLQKKAQLAAARAGVTDAKHAYLPASYLGDEMVVATDNSTPGSYLSFGVIPSSSGGIRSSNNYQAALGNYAFFSNQYELINFGLKKATVNNAEAFSSLSQADLDRENYLVKWQVGKLYLEILKMEFQLGIDRENIGRYEKVYTVIQAVTQSGIKPGADSALAMAELSKTRTTYNQTYGQLRQLQQQLSFMTGVAADGLEIDTTSARLNVRLSDTVGASAAGNPLLDYYQKQKSLYQRNEELVKKSYLPKILLTGIAWARGSSIDYQDHYQSGLTGWGYQRFNYMGGLTFQYNLFNTVHRKDKAAIAHNNLLATDYGLQQQALALQNVGNKAEEGIRAAMKNLQEIPIQVHAAEDAYNQKTAQYKAGIINLVDLTNASFVLYRSQSDYVQTLSDWLTANLDKAAAAGELDQFIQSIK